MTSIAELLIENQRLVRENEDLRQQLRVALREADSTAAYGNIPTPPLSETQQEIIHDRREMILSALLSCGGVEEIEVPPLPPMRLE